MVNQSLQFTDELGKLLADKDLLAEPLHTNLSQSVALPVVTVDSVSLNDIDSTLDDEHAAQQIHMLNDKNSRRVYWNVQHDSTAPYTLSTDATSDASPTRSPVSYTPGAAEEVNLDHANDNTTGTTTTTTTTGVKRSTIADTVSRLCRAKEIVFSAR